MDVSFGVEKGEIFGIAGSNGAGKSTLFNVIAGIYSPTSGKVTFDGEDVTGWPTFRICNRGIGRTFQIPTTFHSLDIHTNIKAGMTFGGGNNERLDDVIELLDLKEKLKSPAQNLDLYTTKMVMMGTVLATGCKLLMLDEPMAGFSMTEIEKFTVLVRKINQAWGVTIL
ncbi:ATP-binding cassette domain-containing protein, partial [bacterium]|nr:ATP-binding cassette domain-containing protein [bacterium]